METHPLGIIYAKNLNVNQFYKLWDILQNKWPGKKKSRNW